jgi:hypothetical protein
MKAFKICTVCMLFGGGEGEIDAKNNFISIDIGIDININIIFYYYSFKLILIYNFT